LNKKTNIFEYLREVFFCIDKVEAKTLRNLVDLMKKTILQIIINDPSIDSRLVNQALDPIELEIEDEENTNIAMTQQFLMMKAHAIEWLFANPAADIR